VSSRVSGLLIVIIVSTTFFLTGGGGMEIPQIFRYWQGKSGWLSIFQGSSSRLLCLHRFEDVVKIISEEVKNPDEMFQSHSTSAGLRFYILVSGFATHVLSPAALAASNTPLLDVVIERNQVSACTLYVIALFAVLAYVLLNFVTASRQDVA